MSLGVRRPLWRYQMTGSETREIGEGTPARKEAGPRSVLKYIVIMVDRSSSRLAEGVPV